MIDVQLLQYIIDRLRTAVTRHRGLRPVPIRDLPLPDSWPAMIAKYPGPGELTIGLLQILQGRAMLEAQRLLDQGDAHLPKLAADLTIAMVDRATVDVVLDFIDQVLPGPLS